MANRIRGVIDSSGKKDRDCRDYLLSYLLPVLRADQWRTSVSQFIPAIRARNIVEKLQSNNEAKNVQVLSR